MERATIPSPRATPARRRLAHEASLVDGAIDLVAGGEARRVSLVLRSGATLLPDAQARGRAYGVIVRGLWRADGSGCDLVVEPIG